MWWPELANFIGSGLLPEASVLQFILTFVSQAVNLPRSIWTASRRLAEPEVPPSPNRRRRVGDPRHACETNIGVAAIGIGQVGRDIIGVVAGLSRYFQSVKIIRQERQRNRGWVWKK